MIRLLTMIINFTKHPYFSSSIKTCYDKNDRLTNWYVKQFDAEYGRESRLSHEIYSAMFRKYRSRERDRGDIYREREREGRGRSKLIWRG